MRVSGGVRRSNETVKKTPSSVEFVSEEGTAYHVTLRFGQYVSAPMTADTARFIRIDTRRRSNLWKRGNEEESLRKLLKENGLKPADYERMSQGEEFYRSPSGEIVIPARQVIGVLSDAVDFLKQGREHERWLQYVTSLQITPDPIPTGRRQKDGVFERPVKIWTSGRQGPPVGRFDFTKDPYLADLVITFTILVPPGNLVGDELKGLLETGGYQIGMGGARRACKGRFTVVAFDPVHAGAQ